MEAILTATTTATTTTGAVLLLALLVVVLGLQTARVLVGRSKKELQGTRRKKKEREGCILFFHFLAEIVLDISTATATTAATANTSTIHIILLSVSASRVIVIVIRGGTYISR